MDLMELGIETAWSLQLQHCHKHFTEIAGIWTHISKDIDVLK